MDKWVPSDTRKLYLVALLQQNIRMSPQIRRCIFMDKYGTVRNGTAYGYRKSAADSVGCGIGVDRTRKQRS
jgi:hypothetical protein